MNYELTTNVTHNYAFYIPHIFSAARETTDSGLRITTLLDTPLMSWRHSLQLLNNMRATLMV